MRSPAGAATSDPCGRRSRESVLAGSRAGGASSWPDLVREVDAAPAAVATRSRPSTASGRGGGRPGQWVRSTGGGEDGLRRPEIGWVAALEICFAREGETSRLSPVLVVGSAQHVSVSILTSDSRSDGTYGPKAGTPSSPTRIFIGVEIEISAC